MDAKLRQLQRAAYSIQDDTETLWRYIRELERANAIPTDEVQEASIIRPGEYLVSYDICFAGSQPVRANSAEEAINLVEDGYFEGTIDLDWDPNPRRAVVIADWAELTTPDDPVANY